MPFENVSTRKLAFAPKVVTLPDAQSDFAIALHAVNFSHTQHIVAPGKMLHVKGIPKAGEFESFPN